MNNGENQLMLKNYSLIPDAPPIKVFKLDGLSGDGTHVLIRQVYQSVRFY